MAEPLDVEGRLAEGLSAVGHIQSYVRACAQIGYRHPELTGDTAQIHDLYAGEEGLDLYALDADCAALRAAGAVIAEALRLQRDQLAVLTAAWTGPGADAAMAFLRGHCDVAGAVVTEVRAAAQRHEALRDNLWQLVDAKVATTMTIDDRTAPQRPVWLAAAAVVTTDESAREIVEQQIKPYVDNDIRQEWRTAMLSARAGVNAAYDMVVDRFAAAPRAHFDMPGDFGEAGRPPRGPVAGTLSAAPAAVAALPGRFAPAEFTAAPAGTAPAGAAPPAAAQQDAGTGWSGVSGLPGGGGGFDSGGGLGGLGGLASRIVAGMGDLLGSSGGGYADDLSGDDPDEPDYLDDRDEQDDRPESDPLEPEEPEEPESTQSPEQSPTPASPPISGAQPATAAPAPGTSGAATPPPGPPATQAPAAAPVAAGPTPCQIAANELPQAGQ